MKIKVILISLMFVFLVLGNSQNSLPDDGKEDGFVYNYHSSSESDSLLEEIKDNTSEQVYRFTIHPEITLQLESLKESISSIIYMAKAKTQHSGSIYNPGASGGKDLIGLVDHWWHARIPRRGVFCFNTRGVQCRIAGSHWVKGKGWRITGIDSTVKVEFFSMLLLNGRFIDGQQIWIAGDKTKSENRRKEFDKRVRLNPKKYFEANAGSELEYFIRVQLSSWCNNEGRAKIDIDSFGLITSYSNNHVFFVRD